MRNSIDGSDLQAILNRLERQHDAMAEVRDSIKEIYTEAKARGYDARIIRRLHSAMKSPNAVAEQELLFRQYAEAVPELAKQLSLLDI